MVDLLVNYLIVQVDKSIMYMQFVEVSCLEELERKQAKILCMFIESNVYSLLITKCLVN